MKSEYKLRFLMAPKLDHVDNIITTTGSVEAFFDNYINGIKDLASYSDETLKSLDVTRDYVTVMLTTAVSLKRMFQEQVDKARVNLELGQMNIASIDKIDPESNLPESPENT